MHRAAGTLARVTTWEKIRRPLFPFVLAWTAMAFARVYFEGMTLQAWKGIVIVIALTAPLAVASIAMAEGKRRRAERAQKEP
jgi:hypothetical protein